MKKININKYQLAVTFILIAAICFIFWNSRRVLPTAFTNSAHLVLLWLILLYILNFGLGQRIFKIALIIIFAGSIVTFAYFTVAKKTIEYKKLLYDSGKPVSAYGGKLEVIESYVGGTTVFPEFYMNVKNNSGEEIIYIRALFRVYDWETGRLKAEEKSVLLNYERGDILTIKPGETKTLKTGLFALRYKKNDIIKYEFIDIKTRKYVP